VAKKKPKGDDPFSKKDAKPPPKCEAMSEKCVADKTTQAKIPEASFVVFTPPSGWTYAQESSVSVAQTADEGPALAVAAFTVAPDEGKDPKKLDKRRDTLLNALGERLALKMPKAKVLWKKADKTLSVGTYAVSLYQVEGAGRGSKKGPLLVFSSALNADVVLLGLGFVNDDDTTDADGAILAAIQSLAPAPPPPPEPSAQKGDGKKSDPFGEEKKP
jgi:hypothetical protein